LPSQSDYAHLCVDHILSMYKGQRDSVILIGHSIGGLVAKSLFARHNFDARHASTLITLATPHRPVIIPDLQTRDFYHAVDIYWKTFRDENEALKEVTFVSIGGGERDMQVN